MVLDIGLLNTLFLLGIIAAIVTLTYFVLRNLQQDHTTGEYHFTWGVGIIVLFVMGFAPGFVGLGLYLTVEKHYPLYWLVLCLIVVFGVLAIAGFGIYTEVEMSAITTGFTIFD